MSSSSGISIAPLAWLKSLQDSNGQKSKSEEKEVQNCTTAPPPVTTRTTDQQTALNWLSTNARNKERFTKRKVTKEEYFGELDEFCERHPDVFEHMETDLVERLTQNQEDLPPSLTRFRMYLSRYPIHYHQKNHEQVKILLQLWMVATERYHMDEAEFDAMIKINPQKFQTLDYRVFDKQCDVCLTSPFYDLNEFIQCALEFWQDLQNIPDPRKRKIHGVRGYAELFNYCEILWRQILNDMTNPKTIIDNLSGQTQKIIPYGMFFNDSSTLSSSQSSSQSSSSPAS